MSQARVVPLLGPALVLYLIADVASEAAGLTLGGWVVSSVAFLCSVAAIAVPRRPPGGGTRRVPLLGVSLALSLLPAITTETSQVAEIARVLGVTVAAALMIDLSLDVPDAPRRLDHGLLGRLVPAVLTVAIGLVAVLAHLPGDAAGDILVPARWADAPHHLLLAALLLALGLRLLRRRLGSSPEALARNGWPLFGIAVSLLAVLTDRALWLTRPAAAPELMRALPVVVAVALTASHIFLVDERQSESSGSTIRRMVASFLTLAIVTFLAVSLAPWAPREAVGVGIAAALLVVVGAFVHRAVTPMIGRLLAPHGRQLLDAIIQAEGRLGRVTSLVELGHAVLPPLRGGEGRGETTAIIYSVDPALEVRSDQAGEGHVRSQPMPDALLERLLERPGEVLVASKIEALVVRRPALRALSGALTSVDALAALPLAVDGELEGALVVPRGRRRSALALEEIRALEGLAQRVSGLVALLSAEHRARARAGDGATEKQELEERIEFLEEERDHLRLEARSLKSGPRAGRMAGTVVAYSAAMKRLMVRVGDIAALDAPVLLLAEGGAAVEQVANAIHRQSGRADGPLVVADSSALRPEDAAAALFGRQGDDPKPGWLSLARGGSLFIADIPALPLEVQRRLADALAEREARPVGATGAEPIDVRVIAAARTPLEDLVAQDVFDAELARWLSPLQASVPSLRERPEDIPSLTLLAIDRACRLFARPTLGIDDEALALLGDHDFPGNVRELTWLVTRAVAGASAERLAADDFRVLGVGRDHDDLDETPDELTDEASNAHPYDGTLRDLERRILVHALETAEGNKSEAARLLGLKRTTFLDKLRRHDLAPPGKRAGQSEAPDAGPPG
ncbi:MAG: sigma-54-dependent Fis family transcriptional regulator [Deltaproteobacteria bacterium]|nr:sigma-54-dependent Fis family transcriptional regulator [Deltaproteobacteria bacterium]